MLLLRNEGKESFFRNEVLRITPEPFGRGEATRRSLSCDDTVPAEPFRLGKCHVGGNDISCITALFERGIGGIVCDELDESCAVNGFRLIDIEFDGMSGSAFAKDVFRLGIRKGGVGTTGKAASSL